MARSSATPSLVTGSSASAGRRRIGRRRRRIRLDVLDVRLGRDLRVGLGPRCGGDRLGNGGLGLVAHLALGGHERRLALGLLAGGLLLGCAAGLLLRLAAGLLLGLETDALLLGEDRVPALHDVADRTRDERARADRVVVAGDHVVDAVGVAVRVDEPDDRDAQALRLLDRDQLALDVDDEDGLRQSVHVLHATEVRAQLCEVGLGGHALADRKQSELTLALVALEVVQAADALADRAEVGQQAAEPTVVDVRHARGLRDVLHGVARLLLGPHEEDGPAPGGEVSREAPRVLQELLAAQQVDDVDPVALAEDEAAHLGVPAARLVAEMDAGLQQLSDAYLWHLVLLPCRCDGTDPPGA